MERSEERAREGYKMVDISATKESVATYWSLGRSGYQSTFRFRGASDQSIGTPAVAITKSRKYDCDKKRRTHEILNHLNISDHRKTGSSKKNPPANRLLHEHLIMNPTHNVKSNKLGLLKQLNRFRFVDERVIVTYEGRLRRSECPVAL